MTAPAGPMQLPAPKLIKDVLDGLLGKDVTLTPREKELTSIDAVGGAVALYVDDNGKSRALIGWDVRAAANAGCAFALIPSGRAASIIEDKYMEQDIVEAVYELSNVMASALDKGDNPHVKLHTLYHPAAAAPDDLAKALYGHYERSDYSVDLPGYGDGLISIVML